MDIDKGYKYIHSRWTEFHVLSRRLLVFTHQKFSKVLTSTEGYQEQRIIKYGELIRDLDYRTKITCLVSYSLFYNEDSNPMFSDTTTGRVRERGTKKNRKTEIVSFDGATLDRTPLRVHRTLLPPDTGRRSFLHLGRLLACSPNLRLERGQSELY